MATKKKTSNRTKKPASKKPATRTAKSKVQTMRAGKLTKSVTLSKGRLVFVRRKFNGKHAIETLVPTSKLRTL